MPAVPDIAQQKRPVADVVPLSGRTNDTTETAAPSVKDGIL